MTFDVSQFEVDETAVLTVQNLKGDDDLLYDGQQVKITLYSTGSRAGVKALHRAGQQSQLRLQGILRGKTSKTAAEDADREQVEKLVAFTAQIENFPIPGGAEALYSNPKLGYIRKQVEEFLSNDANFGKPSSTTSESTSANAPG